MQRTLAIFLFLIASAVFASSAQAVHVEYSVQPRKAYVGMPISLTITVSDATNPAAPELPAIDGFTQLGPPTTSHNGMNIVINGRPVRNSQDLIFTYRLVPQRAGALTIPQLHFEIDGQAIQTQAVMIKVQEATNDGLMTAEVITPVESAYVGEPVELTLRIVIKPYHDDDYGLTLTDQNMWSLLGMSESQWGAFAPAVQGMLQTRRVPVARTIRSNSDGEVRYQYDIKQVVYPDSPGTLDVGNIVLVLQYPLGLRRDFFGSLGVEQSRPVTATPDAPKVNIKPLPEEGRPKLFVGAVGSYTLGVDVKPVDVAVGDPITLSLTVTDVSKQGAKLELLKPPALTEVDALTNDFRVHGEPLAGTVKGRSKTFTQTIRALKESVSAVPAIPFVFFDPQREAYVTLQSDPIPIHVSPASTMALSDIVQANGVKPRAAELTPVAGGILANFEDARALLANDSLRPSWWLIGVLALPPVVFVALAVAHRRADRLNHDPALARQRKAQRRAVAALEQAARANEPASAANLVASAVAGYVADRCNLPPGANTRAEVTDCLSQRKIDPALAHEVSALLQRCEHSIYTGASGVETNGLLSEARTLIAKLRGASLS